MKAIGGLILLTFGALWILAALMGFIAGSFGAGAIQLFLGLILLAIGKELRQSSARDDSADAGPK